MSLVISRVDKQDFGKYKCVAKNPRGQTDGTITLYGKPTRQSLVCRLPLPENSTGVIGSFVNI